MKKREMPGDTRYLLPPESKKERERLLQEMKQKPWIRKGPA